MLTLKSHIIKSFSEYFAYSKELQTRNLRKHIPAAMSFPPGGPMKSTSFSPHPGSSLYCRQPLKSESQCSEPYIKSLKCFFLFFKNFIHLKCSSEFFASSLKASFYINVLGNLVFSRCFAYQLCSVTHQESKEGVGPNFRKVNQDRWDLYRLMERRMKFQANKDRICQSISSQLHQTIIFILGSGDNC